MKIHNYIVICTHGLLFVHYRSGSVVKKPPVNAEVGSILGQEDPLEKEMAIYSSILT